MSDLPARRVIRALERAGFVLVRQRGSHRVFRNAVTMPSDSAHRRSAEWRATRASLSNASSP